MYYFSHDYSARNDKKLVSCLMKKGLSAIGAYWCIVEMLYEEGGYLPLSDCERIIFELRTDNELLSFLIYDSNLFKNDGEKFWSQTAVDRLKLRSEKSELARQSADFRWNNKRNANACETHDERNANKVKNSKLKNNKEYSNRNKKSPEGASLSGDFIPSVEEIKSYCHERNNTVNADNFFNFYESIGWMVGRNKMKNWKASVRTWENKNRTTPSDSQSAVQPEINTPVEWKR